MPKTIKLEIPDLIVEKYITHDELERVIYENIIICEYQKGNLSIRESAELLYLTYEGFIKFLGERELTFITETKDELNESCEVSRADISLSN